MLSFCFFIFFILFFFINLLWSSFIIFLWSYISGKCMFLFFSFSTTWSLLLRLCKYVLQSNVKLMVPWWKYTFQRVLVPSVGPLDAYFYSFFFFGLLPKRFCWGPCWWWFTRNIWPKARVACIFCYGWTHLCQTLQYQKMTWEVCCSSNKDDIACFKIQAMNGWVHFPFLLVRWNF